MKTLTLVSLLLGLGFSGQAMAEKEYDIELSYNAKSKDLTVAYEKFTTSICHLDNANLLVSDATPSLVGNVDVGLISFDVLRPEGQICLMALGQSRGSVTITNFDGEAHALVISGESYGYVVLKGEAPELVEELPAQVEQAVPEDVRYDIDFDYDVSSKNLVIGYRTVDLTSSICHYEAKNLQVSLQGTPTLVNPIDVGMISFDTDKASDGICLTAFGHSGGSITIDAFTGIPSLLLIDGIAYGYITLSKDGQTVELLDLVK